MSGKSGLLPQELINFPSMGESVYKLSKDSFGYMAFLILFLKLLSFAWPLQVAKLSVSKGIVFKIN